MKFKNDVEIQGSDLIVGTDIYTIGDTLKIQAGGTSGTFIEIDDTSGEVVVSADISASNLSGTNTGDQNLSNYVTLNTAQTISGTKTFTSPITINGGVGVSTLGGTLIVRQKGNSANDGIAITSAAAASHRIWKASDGKFHFGSSSQTTAFTQLLDGSVGIGTDNPQAKLHVANSGECKIDIEDTGGQKYRIFARDGDNVFAFYDATNPKTWFRYYGNSNTNSTKLALLEGGGNVGIGTTSPSAKLTVSDSTNSIIRINNTKAGTWVEGEELGGLEFYGNDGSGIGPGIKGSVSMLASGVYGDYFDMAFSVAYTANTYEAMRLTAEGNLGIGTTSPLAKFHINNTEAWSMVSLSACNNVKNAFRITGRNSATNSLAIGSFNNTDYVMQVVNNAGNVSGKMLINPYGGNVGIGTDSPSEKLQVVGNTLINSIAFNTGYGAQFISTGNGTTINFGQPTSYVQNMSVQGRIQASSSVMVGNNTITASAADVGGIRYRVSGNNSYMDMCMKTGNTTYAWVNVVQNQW